MVRHCFTLDQQQKITKSKYITDKGYAVLDESNSDNIINAAAEEGIFDTTLRLSERERRSAIAGKGHDASKKCSEKPKREQWRRITSPPACPSLLYTRRM